MATHEGVQDVPAHVHEHHTSTGLDHNKIGLWAFLGSECLFFGSLISTYVLYHTHTNGGPTPKEIYNIPFTAIVSFVLVFSSLTMTLALVSIQKGDERAFRAWLAATALLGLIFVGGQAYEFTNLYHEGLTLRTSPLGSSFFVLTGFHGGHVTIGILMILGLLMMSLFGRLPPEDSHRVELVALYWGFVDIVWVIIFTVVYLVPTSGGR